MFQQLIQFPYVLTFLHFIIMCVFIILLQYRLQKHLEQEENPNKVIQKMMFFMVLKAFILVLLMFLYQHYTPMNWHQKQNYVALFLGLLFGLQWFKLKMLCRK
jgi:formate hydrogenlyase subunit 3/multisubunit Na+/H+ antiporter MnhD subunit